MTELDSTEINHFAMEIVDKILTYLLLLENVQLDGTTGAPRKKAAQSRLLAL